MTDEPLSSSTGAEVLYTAFFEALSSNSYLMQTDAPRFTILAATQQHLKLTGLQKENIIGKGVFEVFPPNLNDPSDTGGQDFMASLHHVLQYKEPHYLPLQRYDIVDRQGRYMEKYWRAESKPVLSPGGKVAYIIHTTEDITDQVKAAEMKDQMKGMEQAHSLFLQAPIPIQIYKGRDLVLELANEPTLAIWGKGPDIIGKPLGKALPEIEGQGYTELLLQVLETGTPYHLFDTPVTFMVNGKETVHYFSTIYQPYYEEDYTQAAGVLVFGFDVSEKVRAEKKAAESEERFRVLADQAPMMVFMADTEAAVTYWNKFWLQYTGQSFEQALGRAWEQIVHPDDYEYLLNSYLHATSNRQPYSVEARMRRWDGKYRYFLFTGGPRYASDGTLLGNIGTGVDIHDRRRAEEVIKQRESNLRNTLLQAPVAMAILRGSSFIVEIANDRMYELWGRGPEDLLNHSIFEGLPEVKNQGYEELLTDVFTTGNTFTAQGIPVTLPRAGKVETVYINLTYEAYREVDGTVSGIIAVATDVSEQVVSRMKVEESHKELQFVMDVMPQMVWLTKPDGYHYFYNRQWYDYTGLTYGETEGEGWNSVFHPDDQQRAWKVWRHSLETGEPYEIEYRCRRFDGAYRWFLGRALALKDDSGAILKWFGTCTDIDDQKKAAELMEQQVKERTQELENKNSLLDSILKNSSNGISVSEMVRNERSEVVDMTTLLANEAAVKCTGLPRDIYLYKRATEIVPYLLNSPYGKGCIRTLETGEPFMMQYYLEPTGRWLEVTTSKMDDEHLVHIFTDVTPIKEAQLQLERTIEDLKRSNINLEEFAYAASHDLKEPIRKIHFFTDRLKQELQEQLNESQHRLFSRVEHAAERMTLLIEDLLNYSHVSRGVSHLEPIDLNKKVQSVLEDLELEIEEKRASITVQPLPTINGNRRQIQQLFQNLISNALKYSKPDISPQIHISSHIENGDDTHKQYHLIEVSDNGIGFEQKDAERIFSVFTRLHGNKEYKGTGVGLSIAQKVVLNHDGKIWAEGKEGEGATFKVLLPIK